MEVKNRSTILPMFYDFPGYINRGRKKWRSGQSENSKRVEEKKKKIREEEEYPDGPLEFAWCKRKYEGRMEVVAGHGIKLDRSGA